MKPAILLKRRLWHKCFPMNFPKFIRSSFSKKHLLWLLLHIGYKIYRKTYEEENTKYFSHAIFCNLNHCQFSYKILCFLQIIIQLKKHLRQNHNAKMLIVRLSSGPLNTTEKCSVLESNFVITFLGFTVFLVTLLYGKFFQAIFLETLKSRNCIMLPKKLNETLRVLQRRFMHILMMTYFFSNQFKKP